MNGIINIYKEKGYTSHDVVARLRGILGQKKIGHTGTLDPDAEGVLPVCLGKATKLCDMIENTDKEYRVTLLLGVETDTEDLTGTIQKTADVTCTEEDVYKATRKYIGKIAQIPPMYSALKVNGKKLYQLAREGKVVERKPRQITIYDIQILSYHLPEVTMLVRCSKGTYIRSLCRDIGSDLGCGGCMKTLLRTEACGFLIKDAHRLDEIERKRDSKELNDIVMQMDVMFQHYLSVTVPSDFNKLLYNGNAIPIKLETAKEKIRVYDDKGHFIGIYENQRERLKPIKLFFDM
ncbi:MAG: tRNA pseudouridine(55) synthase TruB [Lachnospiraceae bacterium]|nr:tRNA pseudouridine(55) synthase TruB [Lachnospiraceae bacterium]